MGKSPGQNATVILTYKQSIEGNGASHQETLIKPKSQSKSFIKHDSRSGCVPFLQLAHSFKSWLNVSRLHVATERVPLTPLRSPRSSGLLLHTLSSSPRIGREQMTSLSGNPETGCYLWGWICSDRFAGTSKMVACTRVFGIPALTMAFTTAQCLSPAPSFCFPKGVGLSASSTTSLPACK